MVVEVLSNVLDNPVVAHKVKIGFMTTEEVVAVEVEASVGKTMTSPNDIETVRSIFVLTGP